jgi:hypothetical protein
VLYARTLVNDMPDESKVKSEDSPKKSKKPAKKKAPSARRRKRTATKEKVNKSAFVRKHSSLKPAEVVEKANAAGFDLAPSYVSNIRSQDKKKGKGAKRVAASKRSRGAVGGKRGKPPEKKQRVLDLIAEHPDWTTARIAKEAGSSATYAYAVKRGQGGGTKRRQGTAPDAGVVGDDSIELIRIVMKMGVVKAQKIIDRVFESA